MDLIGKLEVLWCECCDGFGALVVIGRDSRKFRECPVCLGKKHLVAEYEDMESNEDLMVAYLLGARSILKQITLDTGAHSQE